MKTLDVIVVGAGIGGLSTALALAADGRRVTLHLHDGPAQEAQDALMALGDSEDNPIFWASGVMRDWLFGWEVGAQTRGLGRVSTFPMHKRIPNPPFIQTPTSDSSQSDSSPTSYLPLYEMLIQPIPISPTFTSTAFTPTAFTPITFIGSPTALIAIARTSRDGDGYREDVDVGVVIPQPIELPRLLAFEDRMEMDVVDDDAGDGDGDGDVDRDVDVDEDSDSDSESTTSTSTTSSTTSTTSHISDISSMTSVSSSSSIAKSSPAAGVVYVPPPMRMYKHSTTKSSPESSTHSALDSEPELEYEYESSIPSHRLLSYSRSQHSSKSYPIPIPKSQSKSTSQSQSKSSVSVCRYKYQGGETGVMTGGVMLGSTTASVIRSPFTPLASTPTRPTLARPTKRGTARRTNERFA
ncbi:hypothetical protein F5877DRAFT_71712 [Lentinula edodes]|nr:hypothetical protein F5877DRAFT_71712 [Lentinula edodes]